MALPDIALCLDTRSQDCSLAKISDESEYGVGGADDRNDHAQYLLPYKMDEKETITFITGVDNSAPLTALEWSFVPTAIGAYRFFYLIILPWSDATAYVKEVVTSGVITTYADIVYHGGAVYKAIDPSTDVEPGVDSGWEDDWEVVPDLTTLIGYVNKDTIKVHIHTDIITCKYESCLVDYFDDSADLILKGLCDDLTKILPTLKAQLLLDGAQSNNWQNKQTRSEVILVEAQKKFCNKC